MIIQMAHACFTVSDLDRAQHFYADGLGLTPAFDTIDENGKRYGLYLYIGGRNFIELFTGELTEPADGQSSQGMKIMQPELDQMFYWVEDYKLILLRYDSGMNSTT